MIGLYEEFTLTLEERLKSHDFDANGFEARLREYFPDIERTEEYHPSIPNFKADFKIGWLSESEASKMHDAYQQMMAQGLVFLRGLYESRTLTIDVLQVPLTKWNQGIGTGIIGCVKEFAKQGGFVSLDAYWVDYDSKGFWEQLGFTHKFEDREGRSWYSHFLYEQEWNTWVSERMSGLKC